MDFVEVGNENFRYQPHRFAISIFPRGYSFRYALDQILDLCAYRKPLDPASDTAPGRTWERR